ncbi:MAG: dihydropteroate synthase, partial [Actinomycetota bacterium]
MTTKPPIRDLPLADGRVLLLSERAHVMGILNVTPDSFSDGGRYFDVEAALKQGIALADDGADLIDVGGESTRPGADPVETAEEIRRVVPVIEALADAVSVPISIDTMKAEVARAALDAGAAVVNDVSAGRFDPSLLRLVADRGAPVVLMHMLGEPRTMQQNPTYRDVVAEVAAFHDARASDARATGIAPDRIVIDPGFGFGKTP